MIREAGLPYCALNTASRESATSRGDGDRKNNYGTLLV